MLKIDNFVSFNIYTLTINVMKKKQTLIRAIYITQFIYLFIFTSMATRL
jgi:hypothetical protein